MYVPAHFALDDAGVRALLDRAGASDLVTVTDDGPVATLLPFVHDPDDGPHGALLGHLARNNDQWTRPARGGALVIVRGPDAYVSPSWYASKTEHGRVVPTWNYVTLHVHGVVTWHDDPVWVEDVVRRLTVRHEGALHGPDGVPWSVDDAPRRFVDGQLRAVVGVRVAITRIEAKAKLSQNRSSADVAGVVAGLAARGDDAAARAVADAAARLAPGQRPG